MVPRGAGREPVHEHRSLAGAEPVSRSSLPRAGSVVQNASPQAVPIGCCSACKLATRTFWRVARDGERERCFLTDDATEAAVLLEGTISGCRSETVAEIRALGPTLVRWRTEILAHHTTGAPNRVLKIAG